MVELFVARLPDGCKFRLLAAEAHAESALRKNVRAYFKGKAPEDVTASKHEDALGLIPHFEEYAQAVFDAYAKELIPTKTELNEYLEELQDCAERFPDYMLPQKFITEDDIQYLIKNPGFPMGWAPSGYWEETFLACWNQLVGKGHLPPTADVSHAFDWVFRWAFRRSQDAWAFRKSLKEHLEIKIADWRAEWLETRAKQGPKATPDEAIVDGEPLATSQGSTKTDLAPSERASKGFGERGLEPNIDRHRAVANVVRQYGEAWKQEANLEKICRELDRLKVKVPEKWTKWDDGPARTWKRAREYNPDRVVKSIQNSLKMVELVNSRKLS